MAGGRIDEDRVKWSCSCCCLSCLKCLNQTTKLPCRILRFFCFILLVAAIVATIAALVYGWNLRDFARTAKEYMEPLVKNITTHPQDDVDPSNLHLS